MAFGGNKPDAHMRKLSFLGFGVSVLSPIFLYTFQWTHTHFILMVDLIAIVINLSSV